MTRTTAPSRPAETRTTADAETRTTADAETRTDAETTAAAASRGPDTRIAASREPDAGIAARWRAENGSATVWVLAASGLVAAAGLIAVLLTSAVLTRHRAETAADLAALAAADAALQGRVAACARAARVAAADSATLMSCTLVGAIAEVVVSLPARGLLGQFPPIRARARAGPAGLTAGGESAAEEPRPIVDGLAATVRAADVRLVPRAADVRLAGNGFALDNGALGGHWGGARAPGTLLRQLLLQPGLLGRQ